MSDSKIRVISGNDWIMSSPKLFWGSPSPGGEEYLNGLKKQAEIDGNTDYQVNRLGDWYIFASNFDLVKKGLEFIDSINHIDLFDSLVRFSDEDGKLGVRIEHPLKVYSKCLLLWRHNEVTEIKGNCDEVISAFLKQKLDKSTAIVFKV